jgi:hypothetical protein
MYVAYVTHLNLMTKGESREAAAVALLRDRPDVRSCATCESWTDPDGVEVPQYRDIRFHDRNRLFPYDDCE